MIIKHGRQLNHLELHKRCLQFCHSFIYDRDKDLVHIAKEEQKAPNGLQTEITFSTSPSCLDSWKALKCSSQGRSDAIEKCSLIDNRNYCELSYRKAIFSPRSDFSNYFVTIATKVYFLFCFRFEKLFAFASQLVNSILWQFLMRYCYLICFHFKLKTKTSNWISSRRRGKKKLPTSDRLIGR